MFIFSFIFEKRRCVRRFLRLVCIFEAPKAGLEGLGGMTSYGIFFTPMAIWRPESYRHEMQHVKDGVVASLLISVGAAAVPLAALVLKGIRDDLYPPDAFPLSMALFPWAIFWMFLVWLMFEFRAYRYADGLSFREILQKLTLYAAEKKFGSAVFEGAVTTLAVYWMSNVVVNALLKNPPASFYHFIVVFAVSVTSLVVFAVVVGWALDVFTRRLFGEALGKFLFATFVVGAVLHPFLGLLSAFLFSWALFGSARDAAAATAIAALSLFVVMLPGLVWISVFLL
jgi:MFS family permease